MTADLYTYTTKDRKNDDPVLKVMFPFVGNMPQGDKVIEFLDARRRFLIRENEQACAEQKAAGTAKNADAARAWKECARIALKELRAVRLWLGYATGGNGGDCPWLEFWNWPTDLAEEIHLVAGKMYLQEATQ